MSARLLWRSKAGEGARRELDFDLAASVGRGSSNDLVLSHPSVSAKHLRIFLDGEEGQFVLEDLGSRNGTRIDRVRVRGRRPLGRFAVITVADALDLVFQELEDVPDPSAVAEEERAADRATQIEEEAPRLPTSLVDPDEQSGREKPEEET